MGFSALVGGLDGLLKEQEQLFIIRGRKAEYMKTDTCRLINMVGSKSLEISYLIIPLF